MILSNRSRMYFDCLSVLPSCYTRFMIYKLWKIRSRKKALDLNLKLVLKMNRPENIGFCFRKWRSVTRPKNKIMSQDFYLNFVSVNDTRSKKRFFWIWFPSKTLGGCPNFWILFPWFANRGQMFMVFAVSTSLSLT